MTRTLKSMETKGWIAKRQDKVDRRVFHVHLTEEGTRLRNITRDTVVDFNKKLLSHIDEDTFEKFKEVIKVIEKYTTR